MKKRFDPKKLTLTDFNPDAFRRATGKLSVPGKRAVTNQPAATAAESDVPKGRTTLQLQKVRGIVTKPFTPPPDAQPEQVPPAQTALPQGAPEPDPPPPEQSVPVAPEPPVSDPDESSFQQAEQEPILPHHVDSVEPRTERAAALHVQSTRAPRKSQKEADPNSMVPMYTRQPKWLKDMFFKVCRDNGQTPSIVLRNLLKSYCNLVLILFLAGSVMAGQSPKPDTTKVTTTQLIDYFTSKAFGAKSILPNLKASAAVRHAFWQTGDQDSTDYAYTDRSNTRLEARLDIPILDISYLRDRSKDKIELRAHVMKSLTKILAAQQTTNLLQVRLNTIRSRLDYLRNQVNIKLINKSDLFPVEDQFYNVQAQLFEGQSTLDQRIIDLAVIAGNDWPDAYRMIARWDGVLLVK